jgi:hypothetical protein
LKRQEVEFINTDAGGDQNLEEIEREFNYQRTKSTTLIHTFGKPAH